MQVSGPHQPVATAVPNRAVVRFLLPLLVFAVPYLFVWQGLDFTDKGLMLAYADGMFRWPQAYQFMSPLWLSGALAHIWMKLIPMPPVLAVNVLLAVLLNTLAFLSFRLLRFRFEATALWCAILLSLLFIVPPLQNGYGYQALSVVLLSAAALSMANGLVEKRNAWTWVSGVLAGVALFARLPNVLGLGLVAAPVVFAGFQKERIRTNDVAHFLLGYSTGAAAICLLLVATNQWSHYISGVQTLLTTSPLDRYNHSGIGGLAALYLRDVSRMALAAVVALAASLPVLALAAYAFVSSRCRLKQQLARLNLAAAAVLFVVVIFAWLPPVFILKDVQRLALTGLVGIAALWLMMRTADIALRALLVCGLIACVASFAGSDVGFGAYALYPVVLPLAAWSMSQRFVVQTGFVSTLLQTAFVFWWTAIVFLTLGLCATYVYRDAPRFELNYPLRNEPKLNGILTNAARRDAVDGLAVAARVHVKPGSVVWATPDMPMVYFLTSTKPFTNHAWDNLYNASAFERRLLNAEATEVLPAAVVTSKGTARNPRWPQSIAPGTEPDFAQKQKTVAHFLSRHRYVKIWENEFFELWLLPESR